MKRKYVKTTLAFLACASLITFSGCGKKDPYAAYTDAAKKTSELKSMEVDFDVKMDIAVNEESMNITTSSTSKMSGINTKDMKLNTEMNVSALGQSNELNVYYTDGYYYTDTAGTKIKYAMDLEEIQTQLGSSGIETDLKKEDFKEISIEEKDKKEFLTFTIDGDKMTSLTNTALASLQGLTAGIDTSADIGDVSGTATVNKDGYFEKSTMSFPLTIEIAGQEMTLNMDMNYTYVNPGKEVTVDLPDDLSEYQEIDMTDLGEVPTTEDAA